MSQKVEKVQKGGEESAQKRKKSTIQNLDFSTRGGEAIFSFFFSNVYADFKCFSWTKNKLFIKWFLGNFKCYGFFWGGVPKIKIFTNFDFFPKLKKVQNILEERGGQENSGLFSTFSDIF